MRNISVMVLALLFLGHSVEASTELDNLSGYRILKEEMSPYLVRHDLLQQPSDTLFIEAGVEVHVLSYAKILFRGTVEVHGSAEKPVIFRSVGRSDWVGLYFLTGENSLRLDFLQVENAFKNAVFRSKGSIRNCVFSDNHYGLWLETPDSLQVKESSFRKNRYGMALAEGNLLLDSSLVRGNAFGIFLEMGAKLRLRDTQVRDNSIVDIRKVDQGKAFGLYEVVWKALEEQF